MEEEKSCPKCAESIKKEAKICRFCGYDFTTKTMPAKPAMTESRSIEEPEEKTVWEGNPSALNYIGNFIIGVLTIPLGIGIIIIIHAVLDRHFRKYRVTNKKVVLQFGIIARRKSEIYLSDIRNIMLSQNFIQRIFDLGLIGFATAGTKGYEVAFDGISSPERIEKLIKDTWEAARQYRREPNY